MGFCVDVLEGAQADNFGPAIELTHEFAAGFACGAGGGGIEATRGNGQPELAAQIALDIDERSRRGGGAARRWPGGRGRERRVRGEPWQGHRGDAVAGGGGLRGGPALAFRRRRAVDRLIAPTHLAFFHLLEDVFPALEALALQTLAQAIEEILDPLEQLGDHALWLIFTALIAAEPLHDGFFEDQRIKFGLGHSLVLLSIDFGRAYFGNPVLAERRLGQNLPLIGLDDSIFEEILEDLMASSFNGDALFCLARGGSFGLNGAHAKGDGPGARIGLAEGLGALLALAGGG